jgi:choline/glycine/proline betaine transport protein
VILLGMCLALHKGLSEYQSGQTFQLQIEDYKGPEFRTGFTRKMPTFGRRKIWLKSHEPRTGRQ